MLTRLPFTFSWFSSRISQLGVKLLPIAKRFGNPVFHWRKKNVSKILLRLQVQLAPCVSHRQSLLHQSKRRNGWWTLNVDPKLLFFTRFYAPLAPGSWPVH